MTEGQTPPSYRPGDVVNGHILTGDGQWVPVGPPGQSHPVPVVYAMSDHGQGSDLAPRMAMTVGITALVLGLIPCLGIVSVLIGPVAIVFGSLGLKRGKAEHKIASSIGLACGVVGLLLGLLWAVLMISGIASMGSV
jgi:hypothetical protein